MYNDKNIARDIMRRQEIKKMSNKELSDRLQTIKKRLNRRMDSLEKSGLSKYSNSYSRLTTYLKSTFKESAINAKGDLRFTTKTMARAPRKAREALLLNWENKINYFGLTNLEVMTSLNNEASRLNQKFGISEDDPEAIKYTAETVMNIRDLMEIWRTETDTALKGQLFDSDSARKILDEHNDMTKEQFKEFTQQMLDTFMPYNADEKKRVMSPNAKAELTTWIQSYNYKTMRPEQEVGNVKFNPISGEIYDMDTDYKLEKRYIRGNTNYILIRNEKEKNVNSIGADKLYDFLLNK